MTPQRRVILLKLVPASPRCFESPHQWREYLLVAAEASHSDDPKMTPFDRGPDGEARFNPTFNYCGDCSAEYQRTMVRARRCTRTTTTTKSRELEPAFC